MLGVNNAGDMLDFDLHEVSVSHAIMAQSDKVWLAADHSKFERKAPIRIGSMADVDVIFTDQTLPKDCAALCDSSGTTVTLV